MKKTNNFKRFAAIASASILAACMVAPMACMNVSAHDITINSGVNNDQGEHTYIAYQIFTGDYSGGILSNIVWGENVDESGDLITNLKALAGFGSLADKATVTAKDVAEILAADGNSGFDSTVAKAFAEFIEGYITGSGKSSTDNKIEGLENGYYLIKDENNPTIDGGTNSGAQTRFLLAVAGKDATINAKSSAPSVVKKVKENTDVDDYSTDDFYKDYNDVADYNIGDKVPFLLQATVPSTIGEYDHYYMKFTDNLAPGFKAPAAENIKIYLNEVEVSNNVYNIHKDVNGQQIIITIEDIKALGSVDADSVINIKYDAVLDTDAEIGLDGNENDVKLEYSSNPNVEYNPSTDGPTDKEEEDKGDDGEDYKEDETTPETPDVEDNLDEPQDNTGETPVDKVIVFTYGLNVNKYLDEKSDANKVTDDKAGFKLQATSGEYNGKWAKLDNNIITGWTDLENATEIKTSSGVSKFIGIDDGTYLLKETTTPAGYNTMTDLAITVAADTKNGQNWDGVPGKALTSLTNGDANTGMLEEHIINYKGQTLPGTGGIGTTLFYLGGGAMVGIAGVYLISKKRMKNNEQ